MISTSDTVAQFARAFFTNRVYTNIANQIFTRRFHIFGIIMSPRRNLSEAEDARAIWMVHGGLSHRDIGMIHQRDCHRCITARQDRQIALSLWIAYRMFLGIESSVTHFVYPTTWSAIKKKYYRHSQSCESVSFLMQYYRLYALPNLCLMGTPERGYNKGIQESAFKENVRFQQGCTEV